ncbi:MAG TPA: hypothetical protein EYQ27_15560 [Gemmatimonadetes bacterium]|nr:hypothetical protein [Gemmatimonadota bacterium]
MRVSLRTLSGATLLALLLIPSGADAQTIPSPFRFLEAKKEVGPVLGYMNAGTGRFAYGPNGGMVVGGRFGIELAGPLSFETVATYISGSRDIVNPGRDEGERKAGEADVGIGTLDARIKFSLTGDRAWHNVAPFIVFGGGMALDLAGTDPVEEDLEPADRFDFGSSFFGTLGVGNRWFISDQFGVRADAVFSLWRLSTPPGFSDPERDFLNVEEGEWISGLTFSLAGVWRW